MAHWRQSRGWYGGGGLPATPQQLVLHLLGRQSMAVPSWEPALTLSHFVLCFCYPEPWQTLVTSLRHILPQAAWITLEVALL